MSESRVGSKGEIFPPKQIRDRLGLRPHTRIRYEVKEGRLVVEAIPTLQEVLREPPAIETTVEELRSFRKELSKKLES